MLADELLTKAELRDPILVSAISVFISACVGAVAFVLARWWKGYDEKAEQVDKVEESQRKDFLELTKSVGRLEAAKDRAFEADQSLKDAVQQLHRETRDLRDRLLIMETTLRAHDPRHR